MHQTGNIINVIQNTCFFWMDKKSKDETAFEATVNNFNGCMNGILKSMIDAAFIPVLELSRIKIGEFKNIQSVYSGLNANLSATKVQLDAQLSTVSAGLTGLTGPGISSEADGNGAESTNGGGVIFKAQYIFMDMFKKNNSNNACYYTYNINSCVYYSKFFCFCLWCI